MLFLRDNVGTGYLPTAGDIDREPLEPVGLGVGLKCGVVARPALPLPPESLLFWPVRSCNKTIEDVNTTNKLHN